MAAQWWRRRRGLRWALRQAASGAWTPTRQDLQRGQHSGRASGWREGQPVQAPGAAPQRRAQRGLGGRQVIQGDDAAWGAGGGVCSSELAERIGGPSSCARQPPAMLALEFPAPPAHTGPRPPVPTCRPDVRHQPCRILAAVEHVGAGRVGGHCGSSEGEGREPLPGHTSWGGWLCGRAQRPAQHNILQHSSAANRTVPQQGRQLWPPTARLVYAWWPPLQQGSTHVLQSVRQAARCLSAPGQPASSSCRQQGKPRAPAPAAAPPAHLAALVHKEGIAHARPRQQRGRGVGPAEGGHQVGVRRKAALRNVDGRLRGRQDEAAGRLAEHLQEHTNC